MMPYALNGGLIKKSHVEFVGFFFIQCLYMLQKTDKTTEVSMVIRDDWVHVCQNVKDQCTFTTKGLIAKLDRRFLIQDLMSAIGIIYL